MDHEEAIINLNMLIEEGQLLIAGAAVGHGPTIRRQLFALVVHGIKRGIANSPALINAFSTYLALPIKPGSYSLVSLAHKLTFTLDMFQNADGTPAFADTTANRFHLTSTQEPTLSGLSGDRLRSELLAALEAKSIYLKMDACIAPSVVTLLAKPNLLVASPAVAVELMLAKLIKMNPIELPGAQEKIARLITRIELQQSPETRPPEEEPPKKEPPESASPIDDGVPYSPPPLPPPTDATEKELRQQLAESQKKILAQKSRIADLKANELGAEQIKNMHASLAAGQQNMHLSLAAGQDTLMNGQIELLMGQQGISEGVGGLVASQMELHKKADELKKSADVEARHRRQKAIDKKKAELELLEETALRAEEEARVHEAKWRQSARRRPPSSSSTLH